MKTADKLAQLIKKTEQDEKARGVSIAAYPETVVETIVFHRLHLNMPASKALKSYHQLKSEFVDWNEVRVSTVQEIREQLPSGADSLEIAVFIKDFLEFVHRERQRVCLEFFAEENLTDTRRFLKQIRNIDTATIDLILLRRKEHPVFPLNPGIDQLLSAAGIVGSADTRDRKAKGLYDMLESERVLPFHHFLLDLSRALNAFEETDLKNAKTALRNSFATYVKKLPRRAASSKTKKASGATESKGGGAPKKKAKKASKKVGKSSAR